MKEVKFFVTSDVSWYKDFSDKISKALGVAFTRVNNTIHLPKSTGEGQFEFFELEEGLGILKTSIKVNQNLKFKLLPHQSNEYLIVHFNQRPSKSFIINSTGNKIFVGKDWKGGVFYSGSGSVIELVLQANELAKSVSLIIHRIWISRHLSNVNISLDKEQCRKFLTNEGVQGFLNLDIEILKTVEDIHSMNAPAEWGKVQLKGLTFKLLSQCILTASDKNKSNRLDYKDVMRVIQLKESLQQNNNQIWPKTEVAARQCMMSRSKFLRLFKLIYNKNYYDLYQEIRMQTAAEMLERGSSVAETGRFVGFVNTSHFSKVFKDHFFIEPSQYKK